jgi:uncharacterized RDD family membrane protein YckC
VRDIVDPTVRFELADRGTRLVANILDGLIFFAMVFLPFIIAAFIPGTGRIDSANIISLGFMALGFVGLVAYVIMTWRQVISTGQTLGKKMVSIKVVVSDGSPASFGRIFWRRNFLNGLIGVVPFYGLVDILWIFGEARQCLHDKLADTIVIKA